MSYNSAYEEWTGLGYGHWWELHPGTPSQTRYAYLPGDRDQDLDPSGQVFLDATFGPGNFFPQFIHDPRQYEFLADVASE